MPLKRATVIAKMRGAFRQGVSGSRFLADMKVAGLSYRRTDMLADWRSVNEIEKKEGAIRFVRKDYYPAKASMAQVEWALSKEFMYKVKVASRTRPDEPITERFANIMSDRALTPKEFEALAWEMIKEQSPKRIGEVEAITGWSAVQRVME
ncbi:unnamed protein product [marine sediment metagenome]|uniref:Uncharacterized protein n=1 Tax=marine sediment metagenome TaxID=412755 RepID=X1FDM9_9ZZZZ